MNRILAISDIHGHLDAMQALLRYAEYEPNVDELYFVGDYIDKGPNSIGTLQAVKEYVDNGAYALMGNHEKHAKQCLENGDQTWNTWTSFLNSLPLFIYRSPFLFVHAGIRTGIPLNKQSEEDLLTIREPFINTNIKENAIIVFGHTPTHRLNVPIGTLFQDEKKLGIDTGAGHNHYLSLVDLSNQLHYRIPVSCPYIENIQVFQFRI